MSAIVRRTFVTLLGGAAVLPLAALAQKTEGTKRVGVLMGFAENDEVWQAYLATFRQALQELGWVEGRNTSGLTTASRAKARTECAAWQLKLWDLLRM